MNKPVSIDPGSWPDVVERIGLGGALLLILALAFGTAFIFQGPAIIQAFNRTVEIILIHKRKSKRVAEKVGQKQTSTGRTIKAKQGKQP